MCDAVPSKPMSATITRNEASICVGNPNRRKCSPCDARARAGRTGSSSFTTPLWGEVLRGEAPAAGGTRPKLLRSTKTSGTTGGGRVKLDLLLVGCPLERVAGVARAAEAAGFDGLWVTEVANDPFVTSAIALSATTRLEIGTAIALAFVRSPMVTALSSWELQRSSGGRFHLGLGPQVKAHNERRFSVPFERPAAKLAEQVRALRAIWAAFAGTEPLDFHGEFYRFDLLTDFFNPGPIDGPPPPVYVAAVNPFSFRMAGEVADGVHVHPLHSVRYLREVARPALEEGLAKAGRPPGAIDVSAQVMVIAGSAEDGLRMEQAVREQLAFYGSTRTYRAPLELAGYG